MLSCDAHVTADQGHVNVQASAYITLIHCVSKLIIISSDNSLSPGRRQAIIWTNAGI